MSKDRFLKELKAALKKLPADEKEDAISYYDEIISDKIEAGMSEDEAVESLGDIYKLRAYITAEKIENNVSQKKAKNPIKSFFVILALCTSPLLMVVGGALLIALLTVIISFAAVALSMFAGSLGALVWGAYNTYIEWASHGAAAGIMFGCASLFAAGLMFLLGVMFFKMLKISVKLIVRLFARLVKKNNSNKKGKKNQKNKKSDDNLINQDNQNKQNQTNQCVQGGL